jgi:hypothetical protein
VAAAAITAATVIVACGSTSSGSSSSSNPGAQPTQAQLQQEQQDVVRFADCMRSHGVPSFPDPTTSPRAFKTALDPNTERSPAFRSAVTGCQHLLPGGGLHPNPPQAPSHAQLAAELAFARCLRSHGFPSFPDPSSTGELSHEMLANAGINIHQPAVVQAADACVGVTHGLVTRADIARFVAGR